MRMTADRAAQWIREELEMELADLSHGVADIRVERVEPPDDLSPSATFLIVLKGARRVTRRVSAPLIVGYLADEEAAVDHWREIVAELAAVAG